MNTDFTILAQFLDALGPEVSGRSSECAPLSDEQRDRIKKFAAGELSEDQRNALLPHILENDTALLELVQALQAR